jgi:signal transduction histidine kinase
MRVPGWVANGLQMPPPSAKRDALLLLPLYLLNCIFFSTWLQLSHVASRPWLLLVWLYGLAALVPLAWRDKAPVIVFAAQCVLTVAAWPFMPLYTPVVGIPVALYAVSLHRNRKVSLLALSVSFIPNMLAAAVAFRVYSTSAQQLRSFIPNILLLVIATVGAWGAGRVTSASQQHVQRLEREQKAAREAEVLAAERRRIARDLHDIVSHAVTVIVLQAAGAARVADTNFIQAKQSLAHIEATGKQVMAELRQLFHVLDETNDLTLDNQSTAKFRPPPGLADLAVLLTSFRDIGMLVTLHVEGTARNLEPSADLAAYRVVQEGLTNVLKHGGKDSHPCLRLAWRAQSVLIEINNNIFVETRYGQTLSIGRGLIGLREQVHAVGGHLHVGARNGRYSLTATLPFVDTAQRVLVDDRIAMSSPSCHCGPLGP